jgi:hypothetical protein
LNSKENQKSMIVQALLSIAELAGSLKAKALQFLILHPTQHYRGNDSLVSIKLAASRDTI